MADISPICSIMVAIAIGAITRIAVRSNLHKLERRKSNPPQQLQLDEKFRIAEPSALCHTCMHCMNQCCYIRNHDTHQNRDDLEHSLAPDIEDNDDSQVRSMPVTSLWKHCDTADGARLRPIQIMIGPVTTGGRKRITLLTPTSLMISARTRYNRSGDYDTTTGIWKLFSH